MDGAGLKSHFIIVLKVNGCDDALMHVDYKRETERETKRETERERDRETKRERQRERDRERKHDICI